LTSGRDVTDVYSLTLFIKMSSQCGSKTVTTSAISRMEKNYCKRLASCEWSRYCKENSFAYMHH